MLLSFSLGISQTHPRYWFPSNYECIYLRGHLTWQHCGAKIKKAHTTDFAFRLPVSAMHNHVSYRQSIHTLTNKLESMTKQVVSATLEITGILRCGHAYCRPLSRTRDQRFLLATPGPRTLSECMYPMHTNQAHLLS